MPFSKRQLKAITQSRGQAYIARTRGPYAMRVAETYIRRKLYALEDDTISGEYDLFRQAYTDIRTNALSASDTVTPEWRKRVQADGEQRLMHLAAQVQVHAEGPVQLAYLAGYFGRLWLLDSMSTPDAPLVKAMPPMLNPEDVAGDYETEALQGIIKLRRILARTDQTPAQLMRLFGNEMGMARDGGRGIYYRMQLITRTRIMRAGNIGAYNAIMAQAQPQQEALRDEWVLGMEWLSSRDNRVCPICAKLDGQIWLLTDMVGLLLTGLPPDSTHAGCRCTVIPVLVPNFKRQDENPPDQTFDEWLGDNQLDFYMRDFTRIRKIKSTQV